MRLKRSVAAARPDGGDGGHHIVHKRNLQLLVLPDTGLFSNLQVVGFWAWGFAKGKGGCDSTVRLAGRGKGVM